MKKNRRVILLMLPFLVAFLFQATQYARAPVKYGYYVVYAKSADIALKPGNDLSPNGQTLIQNSSTQEGLYELSMGRWGPGYRVNYTDAFHVVNREVFDIKMIAFNFSAGATGLGYLKIYVYNDTDGDSVGETQVEVWNGTDTLLSTTNYIYLKAAATYGNDGGDSAVKILIALPESGIGISQGTPEINYSGNFYLWFTSTTF